MHARRASPARRRGGGAERVRIRAIRVTATTNETVVVGLSSGAFMTVQLHVAFSASLAGAGVIAGGPFYCACAALGGGARPGSRGVRRLRCGRTRAGAQNSEITATEACMSLPELININTLIGAAQVRGGTGAGCGGDGVTDRGSAGVSARRTARAATCATLSAGSPTTRSSCFRAPPTPS